MRLLVSPVNLAEALECVEGNVDIIDIKNPKEGSLGANFPWIIRSVREATPTNIPLSATLGDVQFKPGSVALAAYGAAIAGASFVKVGLFGPMNSSEAVELMSAVSKTIKEFKLDVKVVAAGYAEGLKLNTVSPLEIPSIAKKANCDYAMIDTYDKKIGKSIFDYLTIEELQSFVKESHKYQIKTALGGSIINEHIPLVHKLQPDIIGIRGAVCEKGDRIKGSIQSNLIVNFALKLRKKD